MIVHVTRDLVGALWPAIQPHLKKVTVRTNGCYEPEDVRVELEAGEQTLWVAWDAEANAIDAVMVTKFVEYPRRRVLFVTYISGRKMASWWGEWQEVIEQFALKHSADGIEGGGRRGWTRAWPGVRECGAMMFKDLR